MDNNALQSVSHSACLQVSMLTQEGGASLIWELIPRDKRDGSFESITTSRF